MKKTKKDLELEFVYNELFDKMVELVLRYNEPQMVASTMMAQAMRLYKTVFKKFKDEMHEMSVTGMVAGYETPKAFSPESGEGKEEFDAQTKDNAEQYGYKIVPKAKRKHSIKR